MEDIIMAEVKHSHRNFNYSNIRKTFTAEASDLSCGGRVPLFGKINFVGTPSVDGFTMVNSKTGNNVAFYVDTIMKDADNDITGWKLKPHPMSVALFPNVADCIVIIYND